MDNCCFEGLLTLRCCLVLIERVVSEKVPTLKLLHGQLDDGGSAQKLTMLMHGGQQNKQQLKTSPHTNVYITNFTINNLFTNAFFKPKLTSAYTFFSPKKTSALN